MKQLNVNEMVEVWNNLIKDGCEIVSVSVGLEGDWLWTSGTIMENGIIKNNYTYVSSFWAIPKVEFRLANGLCKSIYPIEDGDNTHVIKDWINAGCPGLNKKYEIEKQKADTNDD